MSRISRDELYIFVAFAFSQRSTCARRDVGCVLVDDRGHVLATGYNGVASGAPHCKGGKLCPGANAESGKSLDQCYATHAEQNALLQCADVYKIHTAYCTAFPCVHCLKLLKNTGCERIVYSEGYPNDCASDVWDREIRHLPLEEIEEMRQVHGETVIKPTDEKDCSWPMCDCLDEHGVCPHIDLIDG